MNKNGSGNVIFILLIPIFIIVTLIVLDTAVSYNQSKNYKTLTENIIKEVASNEDIYYEDYYKEIKRIYEYKGYETDMLVVDANEYKIYVENEHLYHGIFSSLFGTGKEEIVKLFGLLDFKLKKSSKTTLKVEARYNQDDELEFEYVE